MAKLIHVKGHTRPIKKQNIKVKAYNRHVPK
jgi:hypothetical protein